MSRFIRRCFFVVLLLSAYVFSAAQSNYMVLQRWRLYRNELSVNGGVSNFLGDLGGRNQVGTDYFIYDLEKTLFKPTFSVDYRYYLTRTLNWRTSLTYGQIAGDDALTTEQFRMNRNLRFKSNIWEFSTMFELQFVKEKDARRHGLKNNLGRNIGWKYRTRGFYLFSGVGVTHFEPKASYQGKMYKLRTLHTEGQGLSGGPAPYKPFTLVIPVGFGFRWVAGYQWAFTIEASHRFTFTDYMDDVSGNYYDAVSIGSAYGPAAAYLSNPTLHSIPLSQLGYDPTHAGYQRGDPSDRDGYLLFTVGVHYRIHNDYHPPYGSMKHFRKKKKKNGKAIF